MRASLSAALRIWTVLLMAGGAGALPARAASPAAGPASAPDGITGVVKSSKGPEAGVWVIAETKDLPSPMVKIVVTDDQGRYVLPDMPKAKYKVWVRGYGLVDSTPVDAAPGARLDLQATTAPSPREAAQYYPANYWYALLQPPAASEFPGTGAQGNGIAPIMHTQQDWLAHMKEQCLFCHQLGDKATRELPAVGNSVEGWASRIQMARAPGDVTVGNFGKEFSATMGNNMAHFGRDRGLKMFADWSDRIAAGEVPQAPPRPSGVERNVVITMWDWADGNFVHDEIATDKRDPGVNAGGPIYGTDDLNGHLTVFDPVSMKPSEVDIPGRAPPRLHNVDAGVHNPMLDGQGRVWLSDIRGEGTVPDFCTNEASGPFAKFFPMSTRGAKQVELYDPKTKKFDIIPVCFGTHHLNFGHTKDNILYFSGEPNGIGWINTKIWDQTHDPQKAQGWCPFVLDTNGDGKIDPNRANWNQPVGPAVQGETESSKAEGGARQSIDPTKDTRISGFPYGMNVSPVDDSIWTAKYTPSLPSGLIHMRLGAHPPETCVTEYYEPPKLPNGEYAAFNARGVDIDSKGIAWVAFGSGHLGRFDRSKCKVTNGPTATGQQCPEGWTIYETPEPKVKGTNMPSSWYYLTWVDLHNVFGLGKDVPIMPGSETDSLLAFLPDSKKWVEMRVPYPLGFYPRGMDARIDDPKAGWKGRAIWSDYAGVPLWHIETGEGTFGKVVKFQLRPNPLAD